MTESELKEGSPRRRARGSSHGYLLIESATKLLINNTAKARKLIEVTEADRESFSTSLVRPYAKRIEVRRKVAIEARVTGLARTRWKQAMEKMRRDNVEHSSSDHEQDTEKIRRVYPVATEQIHAAAAEYLLMAEADNLQEIQDQYGSNEHELAFASNFYSAITQPKLSNFLAESLLHTAITSLNDFVSGLMRNTLLIAGSNTLGDLPPVPMEIIESYSQNSSTKDVIRWAIDRRVDEFIRKGISEWRETVQVFCGITLDDVGGNWDIIGEAVARRSLLNRSGRIDAEYVSSLPPGASLSETTLWESIKTDRPYIEQLLGELEVASLCLGIRWAAQFFPEPDINVDFPLSAAVRFEREGRWQHALSLCDSMLDTYVHSDHPTFNLIRINRWFCKQQMGQVSGATNAEIQAFRPADRYEELGKAALLRDWQGLNEATVIYLEENPRSSWIAGLPLVQRALTEYPSLRSAFPARGRTKSQRRRRG